MSAFTGSSSGSPSAVNKAMNNVCSSNACSTSMLRSKLTEFKDACSDELTGENPNKIVAANYDTLYVLAPLKSALCSKDPATQAYCVLGTGSSGNSKRSLAPSSDVLYARDHLANTFISRKRASQSVDVINPDTYRNSHIMYLFASPDMNAGELCTECTSEILASYIRWESTVPHAMGVANSPTLSGQPEMWSAIQDKCPASFSTEINNSVAPDTSSASRVVAGSTITALAGALAALVALA
ncbi:hypothetical protein FRC12_008336 [Ceratobasidium sp. 428]|nr:hypothetical protein FRC12_008336 [Ceratobasidium sp. 428]